MRHLTLAALAIAAVAVPAFSVEEGHVFERSLSVSGQVDLDLHTDSGGIEVIEGGGNTVRIKATLKAHRGLWVPGDVQQRIDELVRNPPIEQSGNRIRVGHVRDPHMLRGISMRLQVQTPRNTKVVARADSGGISVRGIAGPVEVATDSGGIDVVGIDSSVRAHADSGGIRARDINGSLHARADSGGIDAVRIAGPIDVATDSGGIRLEQSKPDVVRARADSGGAEIRLATSGGYDVNVQSDSGRVTVRDLVARGNISRRRAEGKVRGGGPLVDVQVDSGHITVE